MSDLCSNLLCEVEATHYYRTEDNVKFYLCHTCHDAFELGQVNPEADLVHVDDTEEWDDETPDTVINFKCPDCDETTSVTVDELIEVGTPYCTPCMDAGNPEPEMERVDN